MGEYNKNIKTSLLRFRPNGKIYRMISGLINISSKDELALYNRAAFFALLAPFIILILRFIYKAGKKDLYGFIFYMLVVISILVFIGSIIKRKRILINLCIVIVANSFFCLSKFYINELFSFIISKWYIITGGVAFIMFIYSFQAISSLMRISNKKMFIGLIKYSVGCSLAAIYVGFLMIGAGNIATKGIGDIINNTTVLITSIFFFIDGIHDIYDYLEEKDKECRDRINHETYIKFGMKKKYIFKRILFFHRIHICLLFFIVYMFAIFVCNFDLNQVEKENENALIICFICLSVSWILAYIGLPFGNAFINFIREKHEIDDIDINFFEGKMRKSMGIDGCRKFNPKYWLGNFMVNGIFEDIEIHNDEFISEKDKKSYFERYIQLYDNNVMKIEYDDIVNCQWYTISNKKDKFIGDGFVLNKDNRSYFFVFVTPLKRGKGFGTLILKELEKKVETEERYIQMRDKIRNKEMKTFMLSKNDYIEVSR